MAGRKKGVVEKITQEMVITLKNAGINITRIHTDRAPEFTNAVIKTWLLDRGIVVTHSAPEDNRAKALAEAAVGWFKDRVRTVLSASNLEEQYWPFAANYITHKELLRLGVGRACSYDNIPFGRRVMAKRRSWHRRGSLACAVVGCVWLGPDPRTWTCGMVAEVFPDGFKGQPFSASTVWQHVSPTLTVGRLVSVHKLNGSCEVVYELDQEESKLPLSELFQQLVDDWRTTHNEPVAAVKLVDSVGGGELNKLLFTLRYRRITFGGDTDIRRQSEFVQ